MVRGAAIPFTPLTIEDCANSRNRTVAVFSLWTKAISLCPLPALRDEMTTKFKTLSLLMTKISTEALIALSILTLHE
jgi:hypothetical protein